MPKYLVGNLLCTSSVYFRIYTYNKFMTKIKNYEKNISRNYYSK